MLNETPEIPAHLAAMSNRKHTSARPSPIPVSELLTALRTKREDRERLRQSSTAYGIWRCRDGKHVIWEKRPGSKWRLLKEGYWVEGIVAEPWFYDDRDTDETAIGKALAGMVKLGIVPVAAILDALLEI